MIWFITQFIEPCLVDKLYT